MSIKLVRLVSGEEILGEISRGLNINSFSIGKPLIVVPTENRSIAVVPWMPYCKMDGVEINYDKTMFVVEPDESLILHYNELTTGIVTRAVLNK